MEWEFEELVGWAGLWRQVGGRTERESKERVVLMGEHISGLGRNLVLGKLPKIYKDDPN